ncbi:MAG: iron complex outermembrane receptor protein [Halioglobus sp.]|jgi:iron complex outermembrane receptor protein
MISKNKKIPWKMFISTAAVILASEATSQTQEASIHKKNTVFEEIIVTARKKEASLYETPAAITAFSSEGLKSSNISTIDDIGKYVPNLNITRFGIGNPAHAAVFIRGIGVQDHIITTDPGVGVYVDGVYLGRQMGANLNLSNVERVEVLRGPQGTLYGRNTIGGAINVITQKPQLDEDFFEVNFTAGSRNRAAADFYSNFPLTDTLAMSLSGVIDRRDGVGEALKIVEDVRDVGQLFESSLRLAVDWRVSDTLSLLFTADGVQGENGQSPSTIEIMPGMTGFATDPSDPFGIFGAEGALDVSDLPSNPDDTNTAEGNLLDQSNQGFGTSLTGDITISDTLSAKLIASYRDSSYVGGVDDDAVFTDFESFPEKGSANQHSLELQINGQYEQFDFVSGLYYFKEEGNTFSGVNTFIFSGDTFDINQTTESYAGFFHADYQLTDNLSLGGGLRYSQDNKDADALFTNSPWFQVAPSGNGNGSPGSAQRVFRDDSWSAVTWDANVSYSVGDNLNLYAAFARGYQNGGFPARPFGGPDQFSSFDPTYANNYEVGVKGTVGDFLQLYVSVFHTRYEDLALQFSDPAIAGFVTTTANAGESEATGVEVEGTLAFTENFTIKTSLGFIDAEITQVDDGVIGIREGDSPALTPEWTTSIAPQYHMDLENGATITWRADYSYRSKMFGQSINNEFNRIGGRELFGFNVKYQHPKKDWSIALYGKNIFNKVYDVARLDQSFAGFTEIIRSNDRSEFGLRFSKSFLN